MTTQKLNIQQIGSEIGAQQFILKADVTQRAIQDAFAECRQALQDYCNTHSLRGIEVDASHRSWASGYDASLRKWVDLRDEEQGEEVTVVISTDQRDF